MSSRSSLTVGQEAIDAFAEASGDLNPLHLDQVAARRTVHGGCIAHGALVVLSALGSLEPHELEGVVRLEARFRRAVTAGTHLEIAVERWEDEIRLGLDALGLRTAEIVVSLGEPRLPALGPQVAPKPDVAWEPNLEELAAGAAVDERYPASLERLRAVAESVGADTLSDAWLLWLAGVSWLAGMRLPGRHCLIEAFRLGIAESPGVGRTVSARVEHVDRRFHSVRLSGRLGAEPAACEFQLDAFLVEPAPLPDRTTLRERVGEGRELAGRQALVVGGSRGIGAAIAGALALHGATVWATYARSAEAAAALEREAGVRPLRMDASSGPEVAAACEEVRRDAGTLDVLVLAASPPVFEATLAPYAIDALLEFVRSSIELAMQPLAHTQELLRPGGRLVFISSHAVSEPALRWPHYVAAKAALEGLAAYCARHAGARVAVVRPPRTWTDMTNGPLRQAGALRTEDVAAAVLDWVLDENAATSGPELVVPG